MCRYYFMFDNQTGNISFVALPHSGKLHFQPQPVLPNSFESNMIREQNALDMLTGGSRVSLISY
jgi:hypothetical protein